MILIGFINFINLMNPMFFINSITRLWKKRKCLYGRGLPWKKDSFRMVQTNPRS